jgi:hypothetical protein
LDVTSQIQAAANKIKAGRTNSDGSWTADWTGATRTTGSRTGAAIDQIEAGLRVEVERIETAAAEVGRIKTAGKQATGTGRREAKNESVYLHRQGKRRRKKGGTCRNERQRPEI